MLRRYVRYMKAIYAFSPVPATNGAVSATSSIIIIIVIINTSGTSQQQIAHVPALIVAATSHNCN